MSTTPATTYARARLWTGIAGVGALVALAAALLALELPGRLLAGRGGALPDDFALLLAALGLAALAAAPFDLVGGYLLPRRFGRPHPGLARFALRWLRGLLALSVLSAASGALLIAAGRAGGRPAALALFVALSLCALWAQAPLARLVGGLRRSPGRGALDGAILLAGEDPGFTGGFSGARLVLPERWTRELAPEELALLVERRRRILASGAWHRTRALAVAWNALGILLASLLPGAGVESVAQLATTALGFTLWSFLGLLALPAPSRRATRAADALVGVDAAARARLAGLVRWLDRQQDDEPERSPELERVFHPVPSVEGRLRALEAPRAEPPFAWHLARTALFLSHVGLGLLGRSVHCNAGRPELWVHLPADG